MTNTPLISVIVPIYNVEQYLEECLESLHQQDYPFLEIMLIDDGSTDGSANICDRYVQNDNRFHYYYKDNSGQSGARNFALRLFTGDYVSFVDSDDKVANDTYSTLVSKLLKAEYDMIQFSYYVWTEKLTKKKILADKEYDSLGAMNFFLLYGPDVVWNKLISKRIAQKTFFKEGIMEEDSYISPSYFKKATKILNIPECLYYYRTRQGSIMNRPFSRNFYDTMTVYEQIMRETEYDRELHCIAAARSVVAMANLYSRFFGDKNFTYLDRLIVGFKGREYLKIYNREKKNSRVKLSYRLQISLFSISPRICAMVLSLIKRR